MQSRPSQDADRLLTAQSIPVVRLELVSRVRAVNFPAKRLHSRAGPSRWWKHVRAARRTTLQ